MNTLSKLEKLASMQKTASENVKRTYTVESTPEMLDKLEQMLSYMSWLGGVGHSTSFEVSFDGDGAARIKVKPEKGKTICGINDGPKLNVGADGDVKRFDFD